MTQNRLFKHLCCKETMLTGWYLAQADSRDNFILDPIGHVDFASSLDERLKHLIEQVQAYRYRPRHLLDIDIPKSGLSVRHGTVLPLEESILLHAITYLLAPYLIRNWMILFILIACIQTGRRESKKGLYVSGI